MDREYRYLIYRIFNMYRISMEQSSQVITSSISSSILPSSLPESSQYSVYLFATADSLLLSVSIVFAENDF